MKLVVHDTSILIDLALSGTAEAWFATGIETWTTDLVYPLEIDDKDQRKLFDSYATSGRMKVRRLSAVEVDFLRKLQLKVGWRGLSLADISVFTLSKHLGPEAVLATGDKSLRKVATREKVTACGILRLFRYMVDGVHGRHPVLPKAVAIERLKLLISHPECRLPKEKCEELIRQWGGAP